MPIEAVFSSIALALIGTSLFGYIANKINFHLPYEINPTETYVGPLPYLGAIAGTICGYLLNQKAFIQELSIDWLLIGIIIAFSLIGFLRDKYRFSKKLIFALAFSAAVIALYFYFPGIALMKLVSYSVFILLLLFCLKMASLVYEMPFVLIATSSLTHLLYMINVPGANLGTMLLDFSLTSFAVAVIIYTFSGNRILISSSGVFGAGVALAMASIIEPTGNLILFSFFIPAMTIVFPIAFVCFMIAASYFGNKLHKKGDSDKHYWTWSLNREKVINFTALIFLCLNFTGLLVILKASFTAYAFLFALLLLSIAGFLKAFARKITVVEKQSDTIEVLRMKIDAVLPEQVIAKVKDHIANPEAGFMHIITADSLAIVKAKKEPDFKAKMQAAEMVVPDGAGIVWAADFLGTPLPGRVPGVALVSQMCEAVAKEKYKVFFIGSKPGIADKAAEIVKEKTGANIIGVEHGYFKADSEDEEKMLQKIADSGADIVFVALGVPRQEDFITKLRKYAKHIVAIGVGGSFDVISGTLPRAPQWMQNCGIEWLFRLWLEPKRITRMIEIPVFVLKVMRYKFNKD